MALVAGVRLGPYEILSPLGQGGMGEVYRALDTALNREVALKVLPEIFTLDPERIERFRREAQLLASLNHPNIAAIYGLEQSAGAQALVLELVEGPTLAERIEALRAEGRGLPIDDALPIARQIAEALEAAHDKGVVHRDLKPANIKVTADGTVKVLDFGLAKMLETDSSAGSGAGAGLSMSPTLSLHATYAGVILGTAAYMSPEQARGKPVDRRSDVWAFGCVLYEMLSGRMAFESGGETVSDVLATVLLKEPDWSALPGDTPLHIQSLLRRCLQKDVRKRLPHIGVARIEIEEGSSDQTLRAPVATPTTAPRPVWRRAVPVAAAAIVTATLTSAAWWYARPDPPSRAVTRFTLPLADGQQFTNAGRLLLGISPDGTQVVYVADNRLYVRTMSDLEARPVPGAESPNGVTNPAFSPDGRSIVFFSIADRTLKKIAVNGGAAVTLCPATNPYGISWDASGILFGQVDGNSRGIKRVSANGGKPELVVAVKDTEVAHGPQLLPDNDTVLFTLAGGGRPNQVGFWDKAQVVAQSLKSGRRFTVIERGTDARYLPSGHIVYALGGVLYAIAFDMNRLRASGGPVPVLEGVRRSNATGSSHWSVSANGSIVYIPGPASSSPLQLMALYSRNGVVEPLKVPPASYEAPRVSPDGKWIAVGIDDETDANIWVHQREGTTSARRLTYGGKNRFPVWAPDSRRIAFQSDREGDAGIFWQLVDGTGPAERLTRADPGTVHIPDSWSPDGDHLLFGLAKDSLVSLMVLSLKDHKVTPFGVQSNILPNSTFSPDGRWVAYTVRENESPAIYVQPFPPQPGIKFLVFPFAITPMWSPDGRELLAAPRGRMAAVRITTTPTFAFGEPVELPGAIINSVGVTFVSGGPLAARNFDEMPDGRLLVITGADATESTSSSLPQIRVVLNWFEDLKQRVPAK